MKKTFQEQIKEMRTEGLVQYLFDMAARHGSSQAMMNREASNDYLVKAKKISHELLLRIEHLESDYNSEEGVIY